ncbi:MAG: NmrA family transcriptional regulator [Meiothermus sp.]|nr:SDR family oxidoreductase [Meiothermus hypogaeus]RIH80733.1 3 beta-hydroxysteroid dehydrogenase/Delta 5-->4-isomerase [Meiothermus hypogaeus]GIW37780.1 MAG: NmrA family transcriptional regulator [Meiothermus sp.]
MKIVVFGASRGVGLQVVQQALEQGHSVTAFARNPSFPNHAHLSVMRGDIFDPEVVSRAVQGQDAVVIALGAGNQAGDQTRSQGTAHIVRAMQQYGVRRVVAVSSFGVGDSRKGLIAHAAWLFLKAALEEHERQEKTLMESGLDWTIVRPTGLTNDAKTGAYKIGSSGRGRISRADVADFILKALEDSSYIGKALVISS